MTVLAPVAHAKDTVIKFATLAPEGSRWMKVMREFNQELTQKTGGAVSFKIYPGGVSGDELDMLRKIRIGQLHAGGFTGYGLGEILPEERILDLPMLFRTDTEADHGCQAMFDRLAKRYETKGFVLLAWANVGFVHFFSGRPLRAPGDFRGAKAWAWEGDPVVRELYDALGVTPVPLAVPDVLPSLQTGLVDTVYTSPLGAVALQWFTKVKTMSTLPIAHASGGLLISRPFFDQMSAEQQKTLKELAKTHMAWLTTLTRQDNADALAAIQKSGVALVQPTPEGEKAFEQIGQRVQQNLAGKLYPRALLQEIQALLQRHRL